MTKCIVEGCINTAMDVSNYCAVHGCSRPGNAAVLKKHVDTIDMTPTWTGLLPLFDQIINDGTPNAKTMLKLELRTMAKAADLYNTSVKRLALS